MIDLFVIVTTCAALVAIIYICNFFISTPHQKPIPEAVVEENVKEPVKDKPKVVKREKMDTKEKLKKKMHQVEFKHDHLVTNLKGHIKSAWSGTYSSNGKYMVSCDGEQSILLWIVKDFTKGNTCIRVSTDYDPARHVSFSPDSKAVVASMIKSNSTNVYKIGKRQDGQVSLTSVCNIVDLNPMSALVKAHIAVQLQSGIQIGAFIFHQYYDSLVVVTDVRGIELTRIKCGGGPNHQIELSRCGRYFAVCGDSPELRTWSVVFKNGKYIETRRLQSLCGHTGNIVQFCFSQDSTRIITLSNDDEFKIWDMEHNWINGETPVQILSFDNIFGTVSNIAISPDNFVVGITRKNMMTVFNIHDREVSDSISNVFDSAVRHIEFDPSSHFIAVTGDKFVRILHNVNGMKARLTDYRKRVQLASNNVHKERLQKQIEETVEQLAKFSFKQK